MNDDFSKLFDSFMKNPNSAMNYKPKVKVPHAETLQELARRGTSKVKIGLKFYKIVVEEVTQ